VVAVVQGSDAVTPIPMTSATRRGQRGGSRRQGRKDRRRIGQSVSGALTCCCTGVHAMSQDSRLRVPMSTSADAQTSVARPKWVRRRHALLLLLGFTSGAIDAVGLVALGGVFTSVMTGNLIFLGAGIATHNWTGALRALVAICAFMAGAFVGARIAGPPRPRDYCWPRAVSVALGVELILLLGFSVAWWSSSGEPGAQTQTGLLAADALALGVQSSAILRFGIRGFSTTYMTGTLTSVMSALAAGHHPKNLVASAQILVTVVLGAGMAAVVHSHAPAAIPVLQFGPVLLVLLAARTVREGFDDAPDTRER